jgi:hypothetical protein
MIYPVNGLGGAASIARAQAIDPTVATNFQIIKEIGSVNTVGFVRKIPKVGYRMTQTEYGNFGFWQQITNKASSVTTLTQEDFKTTAFDLVSLATDDNGTVLGTLLYPFMRTTGFSLHIGNPDATIERTFAFDGEKAIYWQTPNTYYTMDVFICGTATDDIKVLANVPVSDPDIAAEYVSPSDALLYIYRVVHITASTGVATILTADVDYSFVHTTKTLTLIASVASGDTVKVFYTTSTKPTAETWSQDLASAAGINATSASIFLYVPGSGETANQNFVYRLQSIALDVAQTRADQKQIGTRDVIQLGVDVTKVTVKLGRIMEKLTVENVLRGAGAGYPKIDVENLGTNMSVMAYIYSDDFKQTFLYGFKMPKLAPADIAQGVSVNAYVKADVTLFGEMITISNDVTQLGFTS